MSVDPTNTPPADLAPHETTDATESWWWCLKHNEVEPDSGCGHMDRLGPYATREMAAQGLETAAGRTQAWDDEDEEWRNPPGP
jgi:hypothetical protein